MLSVSTMVDRHVSEVRGGFRMLLRTLAAIGDLLADTATNTSEAYRQQAVDAWYGVRSELENDGWLS